MIVSRFSEHLLRPVKFTSTTDFEFLCSGYPLAFTTFAAPIISGDKYAGCAINVRLSLRDGIVSADPSVYGGGRWDFVKPQSTVRRPVQVGLADEPVAYPVFTEGMLQHPYTVYESWAPGNPYTGCPVFRSLNTEGPAQYSMSGLATVRADNIADNFVVNLCSFAAGAERDIGFDMPFVRGERGNPVKIGYIRVDADWPRACGMQVVDHADYGKRQFAIYVDAFNQAFIFPVDAIRDVDGFEQNVLEEHVKMAAIPLPSWVVVPPSKATDQVTNSSNASVYPWLVSSMDFDWKFNHLGTKLCCVAHREEPAIWDSAYFTALGGVSNPLPSWYNATGLPGHLYLSGYPITGLSMYGVGLVEVSVEIAITGPELGDFSINLTHTVKREPQTTDRATFLAGYSWIDIPDKGVRAGDLLTLDIERWFQPDEFIADPGYRGTEERPQADFVTGQGKSFMVLRRIRDETTIMAFAGDSILALDMKTASWAVELEHVSKLTRECALSDGNEILSGVDLITSTWDVPHKISHPAVAIYVKGALQEVMFPEEIEIDFKNALASYAESNPTDGVAGYTYVAQNDLRNWSDFPHLRNFLVMMHEWASPGDFGWNTANWPTNNGDLTVYARNFWLAGIAINSNCEPLLLVEKPCFGWAAYASERFNRNKITPHTTFFTHPNGSWCFFDQQRIYNRYGVPDAKRDWDEALALVTTTQLTGSISNTLTDQQMLHYTSRQWLNTAAEQYTPYSIYNTLQPLLDYTPAPFVHCIYDKVHLVYKTGSVDTTFLDLYNRAVAKLEEQDGIPLVALTRAQMKAAFTLESYQNTLRLQVEWPAGKVGFVFDSIFRNIDKNGLPSPHPSVQLMYSYKMRMTSPMYASAIFSAFAPLVTPAVRFPITFSSCLLLGA